MMQYRSSTLEIYCSTAVGFILFFGIVHGIIAGKISLEHLDHFFIVGAIVIEYLLLLAFSRNSSFISRCRHHYRPNSSPGSYIILLVPVSLFAEILSYKNVEEKNTLYQETWLSLIVTGAVIFKLQRDCIDWLQLFIFLGLMSFLGVIFGWLSLIMLISFGLTWKGIELIPAYLPKSFTLGEITVLLQLIIGCANRLILAHNQTDDMASEDTKLIWFVCTAVTAIIFATWLAYVTSSFSSLWSFISVYLIVAILSYVSLYFTFRQDPITWFCLYITQSCVQVFLIISWTVLLMVAILWTVAEGIRMMEKKHFAHAFNNGSEKAPSEDKQSSTCHKNVTCNTRKVFHLFIVLAYIPGLVLDARLLLLASLLTLGVFIILEAARAFHVPSIGKPLDDILRMFVDDKDQGHIFLTHIYLLIGMSLPLWISHRIFSTTDTDIVMFSGLMSIGLGDTMACVVGSNFGRIHFHDSKKTVEGALASFATQMLFITLMQAFGILQFRCLVSVIAGVGMNSLFESLTDQIDNLVLPLVLYPFLCIS
ncbi:dolichol kinase-like [Physella acuta]|uniref:dolichol kinase-like n=1 Tax=Physella acuta TaxID=109671 RepID=UPI0027DD26E0|nr:dolichol kinase-like [Physella acuta]